MNDHEHEPFNHLFLPPPVSDFIFEASQAIGCDASFVALPLISALGSLIGNTRHIEIKPDWTEPCAFWTCVIGDSGCGKSPAFTTALKPLHKLQAKAMDQCEDETAYYNFALEEHERAIKEWRKTSTDPDTRPVAPEPPTATRYIATDLTIESLAPILRDNSRGILVAVDELAGWIASFDAYRGGRGGDAAKWLSLWSAGTLIVDRKTSGPIHVPSALASVTGTIQPKVLSRLLAGSLTDNGMAARLLLSQPVKQTTPWTECVISEEVKVRISHIYERLASLRSDRDTEGQPRPIKIPIAAKAKLIWVRLHDKWKQLAAASLDDLGPVYHKLLGYCARFALLAHMIRVADCDPDVTEEIDATDLAFAGLLADWIGAEARRIHAAKLECAAGREIKDAIEMIRGRGGSITVRDYHRSNARFKRVDDARLELRQMENLGYGKLVQPPPGPKGGRPSETFTLDGETP